MQKKSKKVSHELAMALTIHQAGDFSAAEELYKKYIAANPDDLQAINFLSIALYEQRKFMEAEELLLAAIKTNPQYAETYFNLGVVNDKSGNAKKASNYYQKAAEKKPDFRYFYNLSVQLHKLHDLAGAEKALKEAIRLNPSFIDAHINLGVMYFANFMFKEAEQSMKDALKINPDSTEAMVNLFRIYDLRGDRKAALELYERAARVNPDCAARMGVLHQKICNWDEFEKVAAKIREFSRQLMNKGQEACILPFEYITFCDDPAENLAVAKARCAQAGNIAAGISHPFPFKGDKSGKLTIGYISADMRNHTVGLILKEIFKAHDKEKFNLNIYSTGPDDDSNARKEIQASCSKFVDCSGMSDLEAAQKINDDGVAVLFDLIGHTQGARLLISALKPSPVLVNILGFCGSMGGDFYDYIIADKVVIPKDQQKFYSEKCVYMSVSLQCNHSCEKISDVKMNKEDLGIGDDWLAISVAHQSYKITRRIFSIWMEILDKVEKSALFFRDYGEITNESLCKAAQQHGIDPQRLTFMPKLSDRALYFKRLSLMDLCLDTDIYNGGSTTMDALWAGVPVISILGKTYASRMGAGIINAVGMYDTLVTPGADEYTSRALELLEDADLRVKIRRELWDKRMTTDLFNAQNYARNIETAAQRMWEIYCAGCAPRHFTV